MCLYPHALVPVGFGRVDEKSDYWSDLQCTVIYVTQKGKVAMQSYPDNDL